jgi:hypothetical protein
MKTLTSIIPMIVLAAGGLLVGLPSNAKADVVIVREEPYEHPHYWHGDRIERYEDRSERIYYREPIYHTEPVYYREQVYHEYPASPTQFHVYNQYDRYAR